MGGKQAQAQGVQKWGGGAGRDIGASYRDSNRKLEKTT